MSVQSNVNNIEILDYNVEIFDNIESCNSEPVNNVEIITDHSQAFNKQTVGYIPLSDFKLNDGEPYCKKQVLLYPFDYYNILKGSNLPNFLGVKLAIPTALNIVAFQKYLVNYHDKQLLQFLKYGFPIDIDSQGFTPSMYTNNHPSAMQYGDHITKFLQKEINHGAIYGPFSKPPIEGLHVSPLLTRNKSNSQDRRVIVDLSWPHGQSVNDFVAMDKYVDTYFTLKYPTVDDIIDRVVKLGKNCQLYKVDLQRAFRQLKLDPRDIVFTGLYWDGQYFVDTSIPFGFRHGSVCCQRLTDAIRYIMNCRGFTIFNYIDDCIGCDDPVLAGNGFDVLVKLMSELGLPISKEKLYAPSSCVPCLGLLIDVAKGTVTIPSDKLEQVIQTCNNWYVKHRATRKQLQSLVGVLIYLHKCVKPARLFVNRILQVLKQAPEKGYVKLDEHFQRDIHWFITFLNKFNGKVFFEKQGLEPIKHVQLDACLAGLGGAWDSRVYTCPIVNNDTSVSIVHLEMLNILVALKIWAHEWAKSKVILHCDNWAVVSTLNSGKGRDRYLLAVARNVWLWAAQYDIDLQVVFIRGRDNHVADLLSRWYIPGTNRSKLTSLLASNPLWYDVTLDTLSVDCSI